MTGPGVARSRPPGARAACNSQLRVRSQTGFAGNSTRVVRSPAPKRPATVPSGVVRRVRVARVARSRVPLRRATSSLGSPSRSCRSSTARRNRRVPGDGGRPARCRRVGAWLVGASRVVLADVAPASLVACGPGARWATPGANRREARRGDRTSRHRCSRIPTTSPRTGR